jgi:hypothetical protein
MVDQLKASFAPCSRISWESIPTRFECYKTCIGINFPFLGVLQTTWIHYISMVWNYPIISMYYSMYHQFEAIVTTICSSLVEPFFFFFFPFWGWGGVGWGELFSCFCVPKCYHRVPMKFPTLFPKGFPIAPWFYPILV